MCLMLQCINLKFEVSFCLIIYVSCMNIYIKTKVINKNVKRHQNILTLTDKNSKHLFSETKIIVCVPAWSQHVFAIHRQMYWLTGLHIFLFSFYLVTNYWSRLNDMHFVLIHRNNNFYNSLAKPILTLLFRLKALSNLLKCLQH
jgi:hypothetical protein